MFLDYKYLNLMKRTKINQKEVPFDCYGHSPQQGKHEDSQEAMNIS